MDLFNDERKAELAALPGVRDLEHHQPWHSSFAYGKEYIDYWPSTNKWALRSNRNKIYNGDWTSFINWLKKRAK